MDCVEALTVEYPVKQETKPKFRRLCSLPLGRLRWVVAAGIITLGASMALKHVAANLPTDEFKQEVLLSYINPATGNEQPIVDYYVRSGYFQNTPQTEITDWQTVKMTSSSGAKPSKVELYQRVGDMAWGPVNIVTWSCVPKTCRLQIRDSKVARSKERSDMLEMENANQYFQLEGQQNVVHTFSTVSYADGSFDRIVAGDRVYNVGKNSATISDPQLVEFTWRGTIAKDYRDPKFVGRPDAPEKNPQANFEVGRKGVVSLLVTNQALLLNLIDRKAA